MCAEFAEEAVLQMLCSVLPEETALVRSSYISRGLFDLIRRVMRDRSSGTTRAGERREYALRARDCTD